MIRKNLLYVCFSLLILPVVLALASCICSSTGMQTISKQSLYDRVIQSGKIRCAYAVFFPSCMKDPNTGKMSGIGVDTIELVAKKGWRLNGLKKLAGEV